jgi:hypothetical protein
MDVQGTLKADTEQQIQNYLEMHIHPLLKEQMACRLKAKSGYRKVL